MILRVHVPAAIAQAVGEGRGERLLGDVIAEQAAIVAEDIGGCSAVGTAPPPEARLEREAARPVKRVFARSE